MNCKSRLHFIIIISIIILMFYKMFFFLWIDMIVTMWDRYDLIRQNGELHYYRCWQMNHAMADANAVAHSVTPFANVLNVVSMSTLFLLLYVFLHEHNCRFKWRQVCATNSKGRHRAVAIAVSSFYALQTARECE